MEKIKIGKIVNVVALRGEVKVYHYSDYKERFEELSVILLEKKNKFTEYKIEGVRYQKDMVILKLKGVDDRNAAELLKEC
ncbi:MAG: 16S rRNA processing protein RimM, partial [Firmicutes bacterium]|nr:16S rRNA processing protein RimM [Bacillota bacterium]